MSLDEEDRASLVDMLDFAREVVTFTRGRARADLDRDIVLLRAIVRVLELIGECARRISPATQQRHVAVPWRKIVGMRNIIVHEYGRVDIDEVWGTVQRDLPPLVAVLESIIKALPPPTN